VVNNSVDDDGALCAAFLNGDADAFGMLFRRHHQTVLRLVQRRANSLSHAEDLVQQAFVQAFAAAKRVFPRMLHSRESFPFRAWLVRIALNLSKNAQRNQQRRRLVAVEAIDRATHVEPADLAFEQQKALLASAVLTLPKRQREVFQLRIDLGLPFSEVAQTLHIAEGNAKSLFHHALKRLRETMSASTKHEEALHP
jgi:RNA polymerase sigma-70 factor, ECF subfamily